MKAQEIKDELFSRVDDMGEAVRTMEVDDEIGRIVQVAAHMRTLGVEIDFYADALYRQSPEALPNPTSGGKE